MNNDSAVVYHILVYDGPSWKHEFSGFQGKSDALQTCQRHI